MEKHSKFPFWQNKKTGFVKFQFRDPRRRKGHYVNVSFYAKGFKLMQKYRGKYVGCVVKKPGKNGSRRQYEVSVRGVRSMFIDGDNSTAIGPHKCKIFESINPNELGPRQLKKLGLKRKK